jgi:uncharacterized damage-inducible protein DinB
MNSKEAEIKALEASIAEFIAAALRFPAQIRTEKPNEKAFSATEIVYHMLDVEKLWQGRMQRLISGESRDFIAMDPDREALQGNYNRKNYEQGLEALKEARLRSLEHFRSLMDDQFELAGNHTRYGEMSISRVIETMTNHDLQHAKQLIRTESELSARQAA